MNVCYHAGVLSATRMQGSGMDGQYAKIRNRHRDFLMRYHTSATAVRGGVQLLAKRVAAFFHMQMRC